MVKVFTHTATATPIAIPKTRMVKNAATARGKARKVHTQVADDPFTRTGDDQTDYHRHTSGGG